MLNLARRIIARICQIRRSISSINSVAQDLYFLFRQDQKDRKRARAGKCSRQELLMADRARRKKALVILREKKGLTRNEYLYASVLFHHSGVSSLLRKAKTLAEKSLELGHPKASALLRAIEDRFLIVNGKPQRYGTQILRKQCH